MTFTTTVVIENGETIIVSDDATAAARVAAQVAATQAYTQAAIATTQANNAAASAAGLATTLDFFPNVTTTNLADPARSDALLANAAAQVCRVWNNSAATPLSVQSPSTLGTFAVLRRLPVVAEQTYTLSMHNCPPGWFLHFAGAGFISFFNANGTWNSSITSGFTRGAGDRFVTFTVPAGAAFVAFNVRNITLFSNTNPMVAADLDQINGNVMLNIGTSAAEFASFVAAGARAPDPVAFQLGQAGACTIVVQRPFAYIRTRAQLSTDRDIVSLVLYDETPAATAVGAAMRTGVVDFVGARFIHRSTRRESTPSAFNLSTEIVNIAGDQRAPIRLNGMFLGGGHGLVGTQVTRTAHGKTTLDHGSVYQDSAGRQWVLVQVWDANTLRFVADNTGATDKWIITTNSPTGTTLTHVTGGTNTGAVVFTSPTQFQLAPINQGLSRRLLADGVQITANGVYPCDAPEIRESYTVPNCAALLSFAKANVGITDYTNPAIAGQLAISNTYQWNRWGAVTLYYVERCLAAFSRSTSSISFGDYSGAQQFLRVALVGDSVPGMSTSVWAYVPNMAPVGGVDYKAIANITANTSFVIFPRTSADDPNDPPSHFAIFGRNGSNATLAGLVWGFHRRFGLGVPAARAGNVNSVAYLSPAEKSYPVLINSAAGDADAGDVVSCCAYQTWFLPTDLTLTIPAAVYSAGGKHYAVVAAHAVRPQGWVRLPEELAGLPVSVLKADPNATLHSDFVTADGVLMTFAASYGDVILEIG